MSAYVVFMRTKTIDQKELEKYWTGIKATTKGHPIEVLVAYGKHEVLEGDPIEGIRHCEIPQCESGKGLVLQRGLPKRRRAPQTRGDLSRTRC